MIHRYRIQNFKSIRDVTVELSPVTVLVGRSGVGKSNLVESLQYLRDVIAAHPNGQGMKTLTNSWSRISPATGNKGSTSFTALFSIEGIVEKFDYLLILDQDGPGQPVHHERLSLGERCIYEQKTSINDRRMKKTEWIVEPQLVVAPDPGQIALGRLPSISETVIAFTALTSGIGVYAFPDKVLSREQPVKSGRSGNTPPAAQDIQGLNDQATNYLETLQEINRDLQDLNVRRTIVSALQTVNPTISSIELDDIRNPSRVVVGHKFAEKILTLQLAQESDGFRRFYAHLLALYQRPPKQTLIFEHPEDGIHPGVLSLLAEEFKATPHDKRGQVILTTHSPTLLDQFESEEIRVVELMGFETKVGPLANEQRESLQEHLLSAGELLTTDPARIEASAPEPAGA